MSAKEMAQLLGKVGFLLVDQGMRVKVEIVDARIAWGALQIKIAPVGGSGSAWVSKGRVTLEAA